MWCVSFTICCNAHNLLAKNKTQRRVKQRRCHTDVDILTVKAYKLRMASSNEICMSNFSSLHLTLI